MFDPARLVFIDETSTNTAMVRLRGRCPRGIRLIDHVPHGHWKTITFIAGLRRRAMVAPYVLDGPMNATSFVAYLKRCLAPTLKRGDIVMMDNLPVHKVAERFHMTRIRSSSPQCPFIEAKGDRTKLIHNGGALVHDVAYTTSHAPRALANRRVTGDPDLVAAGWFKQKFFPEPVDLALSLGCGFGGFERVMIAFGLAKKVRAIDISPGAIERARAAAAADAIGDKIKYEIPDLKRSCFRAAPMTRSTAFPPCITYFSLSTRSASVAARSNPEPCSSSTSISDRRGYMRDYNIIGHVRGKRSLAVNATMGERWREFLWQNLIGDAHPMIDIIIERFATDGRTGIVFPNDSHLCDWDQNRDVANDLARPMGIKVPLPPFEFPIGTMFWARVDALRPLFKLKISRDDYPEEPVPGNGTIPHALERLLPFVAQHAGYRLAVTHVPGVTW